MKDNQVIISGVSGRFPKSDNVEKFWSNLFSGQPLYGPDTFPYPKIFSRLPKSRGALNDTRLFDNTFFNYTIKEANTLDPQIRILLEVVYESLWDAGIRPEEWRGTRTGFFLGSAFDDTGLSVRWDYKLDLPQYFAQRVSYYYDWRGPTMIVDTACAASLNALHSAYWSIMKGECDQAVVAGISIHLKPSITVCFGELEMLSKSGVSWCLDEKADGYIRSEAIVAVVLQRKPNARRVYASILNSCTSSDGYTKEGITFPRREVQVETMKQTIKQSGVNPFDVTYVEAHITGTAAGDPIESSAIMEAYRANSDRPLMLGCLKSNIGHSEASAGLCALTKVLKIFQTQLIPPNINMINCNPRIETLREGRLKPVTKPTIFTDEIISVDAFGFGGSNTHVILKGPRNKSSPSKQLPPSLSTDYYPRLTLICNRTKEGINEMIKTIEKNVNKLTNGYLTMLTNLGYSSIETGFHYRSFVLIDSNQKVYSESNLAIKQKPLCLLFDDLDNFNSGDQHNNNLTILTDFVTKAKLFINQNAGKSFQVSKSMDKQIDLVINQMAYAFLIKSLGLIPDLIVGIGIGKIAAQYTADQITWEKGLTLAVNYSNQMTSGKGNQQSSMGTNCPDKNGKLSDLLKWIQIQSTQLTCNNNGNCKLSTSINDDYYFHINQEANNLLRSSSINDWTMVRLNTNMLTFNLTNNLKLTSNQLDSKSVLISIGNLYLNGYNPRINILYPCNYPVEADCPSIGHLIEWKHDIHFDNMVYPEFFRDSFRTNHRIDLVDSNYSYLADYLVDGSVTLPIAGYIWIIWEHLVKMRCSDQHVRYHSFELWSTQIHRLTCIKDPVEFRIGSNPVTHEFIVKLGEDICVTGFAKIVDDLPFDYNLGHLDLPSKSPNEQLTLTSEDFYTEMSIRGLTVKPNCQAINSVTADGLQSKIKFTGNWIVFFESCLLVPLLGDLDRCLKTVTSLDWFRCDPIMINDQFKASKKIKNDPGLNLVHNTSLGTFGTHGLVFKVPNYNSIGRSLDINNLHHKFQTWIPYFGSLPMDHVDYQSQGRVNYLNAVDRMLNALDNPRDWINVPTLMGSNDVLLNLLWETYKNPRPVDHLREQFISNRVKLNQDRLIYEQQTQLLLQHLAIFEENVKPNGTINIKSMGLSGYPFEDICYNSFRRIRNRYSFASESTPIKNLDLIIYNHESMSLLPSLDDEQSIQQLTDHLSSMESSSFVIVQLRDSVLPLENKLSAYTKIEMIKSMDRNRVNINKLLIEQNFIPISEYSIANGQMYSLLFRKKVQFNSEKSICHFTIKDRSYEWITELQKEIANPNYERIWLIADKTDRSGIIGLINSLKEEQFGNKVRCIFSPGSKIDLNSEICSELQSKDLVINVLSNQTWGSFRHFGLSNEQIFTNHKQVYLDWSGDNEDKEISSKLVWCKLPNLIVKDDYVVNHYAPLDFTIKSVHRQSIKSTDCAQGVGNEFAGQTKNGIKVLGLCTNQGVSNIIKPEQLIFALPVPNNWNLKDASSIVLPYTIAYYSLIVRGSLKYKSTVLLYNLTDGLIEASVTILTSLGCNVIIYHDNLSTANLIALDGISKNQLLSPKVDLLKQIGSHTDYQGLDYIFSMDSTDKLENLSTCLSLNGKLIHLISGIQSQNQVFESSWLPVNSSLESIVWPEVIKAWSCKSDSRSLKHLDLVVDYLKKGLTNGQIKPIKKVNLFKRVDLIKAINQLSSSNPLGRVVIQLIDNEGQAKQSVDCLDLVPCEARTKFNSDKCYLIFGGLGGVGLQLGQWIVEHGGRKIILISRKGVTKNFQRFMIHKMMTWPDKVNPVMVKTFELPENPGYNECLSLIEKIQSTISLIGGVFNLAGTLASGLFENQTIDNYNLVCSSKVELTEHLDVITRSYCSSLDYFVCFSSIGSTGILGESNYCYANSYMERICEARWSSGHPACAIQYGAIGDVGMATDNSLTVIAGSVPQPIFSCLQSLDKFLQLNYPVMYSAISAEKSGSADGSKGGFIQHIEHILGLQNLDTLDETITLGDLGLDSLQSIEVKDLIDKTYGVTLQNIAIGKLSIGSLLRFKEEHANSGGSEGGNYTEEVIINLTDKGKAPVFFFPPALFDFLSMKALAESLQRTVIGVDLPDSVRQIGNLHKIAEFYANKILEKFPDESKYYFVGYSYGCLIAFEVAKVLQQIVGPSKMNCLCFIDATPYGLKRLGQITTKAALLGLPGSEVFCIAMDHLGVHFDEPTRQRLLEAEDDDERYIELVTELMASAGMNGPAEGLLHNPVANIDRGYYLTHMDDLGKFNGDALFIRVLSKTNHGKPSTVCEGLSKIITGKIKEVLYNASHFDVLKVYAKEIAQEIEEMMPPDI